jgi:hypothetical protein
MTGENTYVDNDGAEKTTSILCTVVRVIPRRTILISTEFVCKAGAGSDWALTDAGNTIRIWGGILEETVPMNTSTFLRTGDLVVNGDFNPITPVGFDERLKQIKS